MQIPRFRCKIFLHLIPEPEEKASELLHDLNANDKKSSIFTGGRRSGSDDPSLRHLSFLFSLCLLARIAPRRPRQRLSVAALRLSKTSATSNGQNNAAKLSGSYSSKRRVTLDRFVMVRIHARQ